MNILFLLLSNLYLNAIQFNILSFLHFSFVMNEDSILMGNYISCNVGNHNLDARSNLCICKFSLSVFEFLLIFHLYLNLFFFYEFFLILEKFFLISKFLFISNFHFHLIHFLQFLYLLMMNIQFNFIQLYLK
jgi:hypothetical protein